MLNWHAETDSSCSWSLQQHNGNGITGNPSGGLSAADTYTDIRYDDDYEKFYASAAAGASGLKLPPPLEQRTLYHDLPRFSQPQGDASAILRPPSAVNLNGSYVGALPCSVIKHSVLHYQACKSQHCCAYAMVQAVL